MKLKYAITFVADMDRAVAFHRDVLKLKLAFQTPDWSECDTGETRIALHISGLYLRSRTSRQAAFSGPSNGRTPS